jgi:hypothetical protein
MNDAPKLLIEWSSPWAEFLSSIRPALGRSRKPLAGEAQTGLFPYRGILISWVLETTLLVAAIVVPARIASMRPYTPPPMPKYDVIYFSGDELPQTEDLGGAQSGRAGRAGGQHAHHRTQTIRVARGESPSEKVVDAPKLNLPRTDNPVANLLAVKKIPGAAPTEGLKSALAGAPLPQIPVVPPSPAVARNQMRSAAALNATVIAPAPQVVRSNLRASPIDPSVVPPAPTAAQRDVASMRVPIVSSTTVVPPPVSAPESETSVNPKLLLPAPSVIAPPPAHVTRDSGSLGGAGVIDIRQQVVPPPVPAGTRSLDKQLARGLPGANEVVQPPVQAGTGSLDGRALGGLLAGNTVVPPPVEAGNHSLDRQIAGGLANSDALLANNVVPPPPTVARGTAGAGRGSGNKGTGSGGPLDIGSAVAPPTAGGGAGGGKGIVVSSQPGSKLGIPGNGGTGSLVMSPAGAAKSGLGGSGGGTSIGRGSGPGSGLAGEGAGAGKDGKGHGSDQMARGGLSPFPGPGGVGRRASGTSAIPGVAVSGGSTMVTLPSFGSDGNDPSIPGHSPEGKERQGPGITVFGTSRSGGAFNFYDKLKGDNYTIYIPTSNGTVVMQFADPNAAAKTYAGDLTAPDPIRAELPRGLQKSRLVIACLLDRSGQFQDLRVVERGTPEMTEKIMAALASWKFRPATRNGQPIEVNAILGFNIDTR